MMAFVMGRRRSPGAVADPPLAGAPALGLCQALVQGRDRVIEPVQNHDPAVLVLTVAGQGVAGPGRAHVQDPHPDRTRGRGRS